jgi:DegV family protein with EDD domain
VIAIVTDSTADLTAERAQGMGIQVAPLTVCIDDVSYDDGSELPAAAFYQKLRQARTIPTTSQPAPGRFIELYQRIEADEIVSVHLSGALSGTLNSARAAAEQVPGKRIRVIDSRSVSLALGYLAVIAATAAADGASLDAVCQLVEANIGKTGFYAALDTLQHAQRSGRIGFAQALLGSMLQIKPIITLRDGAVQQFDRPRTMRKALDRIVDMTGRDGPLAYLAVAHADNEPLATELAERLAAVSPGEIEVVATGAVVGTHCGPGAVATCYIRK